MEVRESSCVTCRGIWFPINWIVFFYPPIILTYWDLFLSNQTEGRIVAFLYNFIFQCYIWNIIAEPIFEASWIGLYNRSWYMNLIRAKMHVSGRMAGKGYKNRNRSHYWDSLKPRWKIWSANLNWCSGPNSNVYVCGEGRVGALPIPTSNSWTPAGYLRI